MGIGKHFTKDFPIKKNSKGILLKNFLLEVPDQFTREFLYKINRNNFTKDFLLNKKIFAIFVFSDFAQKIWKKIRFEFENREKIYKGFPCKKNYREFLCKIFCWRSPINLQGNSFIKFHRKKIYKGF